MKIVIDVNKLLQILGSDDIHGDAISDVLRMALQNPVEDVAPVVHGKWIDNGLDSWDGSTYYFRQCNSCGYERDDCNPDYDTPYCPNCGARMDGTDVI